MTKMNNESQQILSFLHFGYVPDVPDDMTQVPWIGDYARTERNPVETIKEPELIDRGVHILEKAFRDVRGELHILPLSGGLDSRAILGGLLNAGIKDNIIAVTFGTPGTLDYTIGRRVAEHTGVKHESIDLTRIELKHDLLVETARESGAWNWIFDAFYNRLICEKFGKEAIYWSGFMGEALTGAHLPETVSRTWDEARKYFITWNRFTRSTTLTPPEYKPESMLPEVPMLPQNLLSYDDQLDFVIRQQSYIRVILLREGYIYRTPFLHPEWFDFILCVPRRYRQNQYLYRKILRKAYPELFALPTKTNDGLPLDAPVWKVQAHNISVRVLSGIRRLVPGILRGVYPKINYIDFDSSIRGHHDINELVYRNLQDLKRRRIVDWIDIDSIWQRHIRGRGNYADALTLLASLEINLKVKDNQCKIR